MPCTCITLFSKFLVHCTTTTWNLPMRRFMEDIRQQIFLSLFEHDKVIKNLTPGKVAYIWRNVPFHVWKDAIFLVMFWLPSSSLLPKSHPTTVFCKISVRRTKYCLEFSITWGGQKKFLDVINSLQFSEQLIFHISLPRLGYFS